MTRTTIAVLLQATLVVGCAPTSPHRVEPVHAIEGGIVIENVTLISPERATPLADADVVIEGDRIVAIGTNLVASSRARRIDGRGRFLIPGLIDSHVHIGHPIVITDDAIEAHPELLVDYRDQLPRSFLYYGYTSVVDLDFRSQHGEWWMNSPAHPDLFHCGRGVRMAGGYGPILFPPELAYKIFPNVVYEPAHAEAWPTFLEPADHTPARAVAKAVEAGAICIKTYYQSGMDGNPRWPVPSANTLQMLRANAGKRGLPFVVHATEVAGYEAALDSGANIIAHGVWHWPGDKRDARPTEEIRVVVKRAAQKGVFVQPTLQVIFGEKDTYTWKLVDDPRLIHVLPPSLIEWARSESGRSSQRQLREIYAELNPYPETPAVALLDALQERVLRVLGLMNEAGVPLLFGTDTPSSEGIGNPPGLNGRLEMQRWVDAGVPLRKILEAATLSNARAFHLETQLGTIEPGKRANLVLLTKNPLETIEAYDAIEMVVVAGKPIPRSALSANQTP
jgi:imidazolonepropionase-like amidohydrolase